MKYGDNNDPEIWLGGHYELSIEYHPSGDSLKLNNALETLYKSGLFNGMWAEKRDYLKSSVPLPITIEDESVQLFYGTLSLSKDHELPCEISVIRIRGESDWLDISIPQGILEETFPYTYPLTLEENPWLSGVIEMYAKLAESIFQRAPFNLAMIGEEVSGYANEASLSIDDVENLTLILPLHLQTKLRLNGKGRALSNNLKIYFYI